MPDVRYGTVPLLGSSAGGRYRRRDDVLLEPLRRPRTLEDVVAHRLVYRAHVQLPFADAVERRTAVLHLTRLERRGLVVPTADGYLAI